MTIDYDAIRARCDAATPGPWLPPRAEGHSERDHVVDHEGCRVWPWGREEDMVFAYHAREDVPALLDRIDAVKAICEDDEKWDLRIHGSAQARTLIRELLA